jgi:PBP1b-binding outer membrane lipoprotein LpoB
MKCLSLLVLGALALVGCSKTEEASGPAETSAATNVAPVQSAPGAPANADKPLTDGRIEKSSDAAASGAGVGGGK